MADTPLVKRLGIKPDDRVLLLNAPEGYEQILGELPEGAVTETNSEGLFDFVQLFVKSIADVENQAKSAIEALKPGGVIWFSYPKKSSKIKTDISRDVGWDAAREAGFEVVSAVSIDDTWSALRFRPLHEIRVMTRKS
jgi:hypothetical protein